MLRGLEKWSISLVSLARERWFESSSRYQNFILSLASKGAGDIFAYRRDYVRPRYTGLRAGIQSRQR